MCFRPHFNCRPETTPVLELCYTNPSRDSSGEFRVIVGEHKRLGANQVQDQEKIAALKQHGSLSIWLNLEMIWESPPSGTRGRQQRFTISEIQISLTMNVLSGKRPGPCKAFCDWLDQDYSTLCRPRARQATRFANLPRVARRH